MRDSTEQFRQAIYASGLEPPNVIEPDKLHRFPGIGKRNGNTAGWCKLFADCTGGVFGDWTQDFSDSWQAKREKPFTESERKAFKDKCEREKQARQVERERQHAEARKMAQKIWREAKPETGEHRYLRDKGVDAYGIRCTADRLVIPVRSTDETLHSLQYIDPRGEKLFLKDARVAGCYHAIGKPEKTLCICEGYATGATIRKATGHAVAVAFNAGNLTSVALALREKLPGVGFILCADNDIDADKKNTGIEEATKAARAVGGLLAIPEMDGGKCDFNDLARCSGLEAIRACIANAKDPAKEQSESRSEDSAAEEAETFKRLATLPPIEYDRCRESQAKLLGIRIGTLDDEVKRLRPRTETGAEPGAAVLFEEPGPWPDPVDGSTLLEELAKTFSRYLVLPASAADALALWAAHTHVCTAFEHTPRINVTAPVKGCGKTLVLDVLQTLVAKGLRTENVSTAVTFRLIDAEAPTLLIDEYDSFLRDNEDLRGALNAGHKRGGRHLRCEGDKNEVRAFKTFAPVALAGIGSLPGTLADRSIIIRMERAKPGELRERFDSRKATQTLKRQLIRWAHDNRQRLEKADPELPGLYNRRADNWRPLFAIANLAGGAWLNRVQQAVKSLTDKTDEGESAGVLLLADIRQIFETKKTDKLGSNDLVNRLVEMEERPWPEYRRGKPITTRQIASLLRQFGIIPGTKRDGDDTFKGYELTKFTNAFARYLADLSVTASQPAFQSHSDESLSVTSGASVTDTRTPKPAPHKACDAVTDLTGGNGAEGWNKPAFEMIPNPLGGIPWHDQYPSNSTTIDRGPWSIRI